MLGHIKEFWRRLVLALKAFWYVLRVGPGSFLLEDLPSEKDPAQVVIPPKEPQEHFVITEHISDDVSMIVHSETGGAKALKVIEDLRARGVTWSSTRAGKPWDWGPR